LAVPAIRRESDGKRWTSPKKRGTLGDLGRINLDSGGFFWVLGPNMRGIERKKRAFYSIFFGFLCIFMANYGFLRGFFPASVFDVSTK
jgi:hypothetical protein